MFILLSPIILHFDWNPVEEACRRRCGGAPPLRACQTALRVVGAPLRRQRAAGRLREPVGVVREDVGISGGERSLPLFSSSCSSRLLCGRSP